MARSNIRSISLLIVVSVITVLLTVTLLVGWTIVVVQNMGLSRARAGSAWLLVGGIAIFVVILSVLVLFSVFLVREILEVRRQERFIDSVTHELRSALASIKLCLDTLARPEVTQRHREELRPRRIEVELRRAREQEAGVLARERDRVDLRVPLERLAEQLQVLGEPAAPGMQRPQQRDAARGGVRRLLRRRWHSDELSVPWRPASSAPTTA